MRKEQMDAMRRAEMGVNTSRWGRAAFVIAPLAFCLAILAGLFVPVYSDEIGWRLQERAGLDGADKLFSTLCGPTSIARPPFWMMPARYYSAFWNVGFASPFYTRVSGLMYALVWGVLLALTIRQIAPDRARARILTTMAFAILAIGLTPWLLVWSRPEQPILICLTAAILVSAQGWGMAIQVGQIRGWLLAAAIVILSTIAVSYHLKAFFLAPAFIACIAVSSRGRQTLISRLAGSLTVAVIMAQGAAYWIARLRCPSQQAFLSSQNIGSELVAARSLHEAVPIVLRMLVNINPFPYIARTVPRPNPMSAWLVELQISIGSTMIWWVAITFLWTLVFLFAASAFVRQAKLIKTDRLDPRLVIVTALLISMVGWIATQVAANDYEAALIIPIMLLCAVLALSCSATAPKIVDSVQGLATGATAAAVISMVLVATVFGSSLASASRRNGYLPLQPHSISAFGYEGLRTRIVSLARQCGIVERQSRNLVIDDVTYYAFMTNPMPDHAGGFGHSQFPDLSLDYLRGRRSEGVITTCSRLPRALQSMARKDRDLCCLAPTWNQSITRPVK
jgi:hypothetical protein